MLPCKDLPFAPVSFLQKIYQILSTPSLDHIISWHTAGALFFVKSIPDLCEHVLPIYFKHSNYSSFVRQLNMYDFHKIREGEWENAFRHPLFQRDRPELLSEIKRKSGETRDPMAGTIVPVGILTRAESEDLMQKLSSLDIKHKAMSEHISFLEARNSAILERNRALVRSLCYIKEREEHIEHMMLAFASYIQRTGYSREIEAAVQGLMEDGERDGRQEDEDLHNSIDELSDATVKKQKLLPSPEDKPQLSEDEDLEEILHSQKW